MKRFIVLLFYCLPVFSWSYANEIADAYLVTGEILLSRHDFYGAYHAFSDAKREESRNENKRNEFMIRCTLGLMYSSLILEGDYVDFDWDMRYFLETYIKE